MTTWNDEGTEHAVAETAPDEAHALPNTDVMTPADVDGRLNDEIGTAIEAIDKGATFIMSNETDGEEATAHEAAMYDEQGGDVPSIVMSDQGEAIDRVRTADGTHTVTRTDIVEGAEAVNDAEVVSTAATVEGVDAGDRTGIAARAETVDDAEGDVHADRMEATEREAGETETAHGKAALLPDALVMEMIDELRGAASGRDTASRRNRKQARNGTNSDAPPAPSARQRAATPYDELPPAQRGSDEESFPDAQTSISVEANGTDWRQQWPRNELLIFGRLDMFVSFAPTVDGVSRIRAAVEIMEIDESSDAAGIVARVPVQILPKARGFRALFGDMTRSPKSRQRARPVAVELRGSSKCLQDRDRRYANARWTTLFGLEVTSIKRVDENVDQYGRWRGTGVVTAVRPFEFDYVRYFRVTLSVVPTAQKAQLRGTSSAVDLVDILVRDEHEHAARFRHVGQRLLVEAEVCSQTSVLRESHPDLEGLDDEMKERLRILREGILLATMGEFPDERAEADWDDWNRAGRPMPAGRPGRRLSPEQQRAQQQRSADQRAREQAASAGVVIAEPA